MFRKNSKKSLILALILVKKVTAVEEMTVQMKKVVTALEASTTATTALASAILALAGGTRNVIFSPKRRTLTLEFVIRVQLEST